MVACITFLYKNRKSVLDAAKIQIRSNRYPHYVRSRIANDYVLITSVSQLRRSLKQLAVSFSVNVPNLGFNKFRKYMTSLLVDAGNHSLAQFINSHRNMDTTLTNYDVGTKQSMEKTLNTIMTP